VRPVGSTNAVIPDTPASTTHRAVSTARIWLICRCWSAAAVKPYEALFTGTTRNSAPSLTKPLVSAGNAFSKQIGVPYGGRPGCEIVWIVAPGARSIGICWIAEIHASRERHGTNSPNGTRCTLS
jgi:hypothetical protein